eukprot:SAG11_NODE_13302_length_661_cov_0.891459_1_plen_96_part_10
MSGRKLREAAERGDRVAVQELIAKGVNLNEAGSTRWTALHRASERGRTTVVEILLEAGADHTVATAYGGDTALHLACDRGHSSTVMKLLENGGDPK